MLPNLGDDSGTIKLLTDTNCEEDELSPGVGAGETEELSVFAGAGDEVGDCVLAGGFGSGYRILPKTYVVLFPPAVAVDRTSYSP